MNALSETEAAPEAMLAADVASFVSLASIAYASAGAAIGQELRVAGAAQARAAVTQPPALAHIGAALEAMPAGDLRAALESCASRLPWTAGNLPKSPGVVDAYAFIEILGPDGIWFSDRLRFGLYLQAPGVFYPPHDHEAEEFYYVLAGDAEWQRNGQAFASRPPGALIHHAPRDRHAMKTGNGPLLAMWMWTGDIDMKTYRIDGAAA